MKIGRNHFWAHGPFAESVENAHEFGSGLVISGMVSDAILKMSRAHAELEQAIEKGDFLIIEQKKIEVEAWESSLKLTCFLLEAQDLEDVIT